jgi:RNA polymerase sigma-70 factor, ECF subfamily
MEFERERIDNFLWEELKAGNQRAFDKVFNDHYKNLCRFAFSMVHDEDSAQSIVQQVFIKLWEKRASLDHIEKLVPYLTKMVRNHSINFINREKRSVKLADFPSDAQTGNTTENQIDANDFEEQLVIALSVLPERCRMAFEYSRFENYTNNEIAQKMEITIKGVEALIGRALKSLRISLSDYLPSRRNKKSQNPILFLLFRIGKGALRIDNFPKVVNSTI